MSFPRYPTYKDSGVEWLGKVPEHWEPIRYKNVFLEKTFNSGAHFQAGSISFGRVVFKDDEAMNEATKATYQEVLRWEFLINPINLNYDLKSLRTALSEIDTCVSPAYIVLQGKIDFDRSYMKHQLSVFDVRHMKTLGAGVRQTISFSDIGACFTQLPPVAEQTQIAAFLERETAKIDDLVAEQRRLIELLKEKRQVVISHAVTKGLNPTVPMKPSGIEWLGDVPTHWEIKKIKHFAISIEQGWSPQCEGYPAEADGEWGVLKVGCVNGGSFNASENKLLPAELEPIPALVIANGDLLISRANSRELVGSAAVVERDYPNLMICDKLYRVRFHLDQCSTRFVSRYFGCTAVRGQIELDASGASASMQNIGQSAVMELAIAAPPLKEQLEIVAALDVELSKLDTLTAEAQQAIDLLQERRTALISAAVTGQIDVRNFVASSVVSPKESCV